MSRLPLHRQLDAAVPASAAVAEARRIFREAPAVDLSGLPRGLAVGEVYGKVADQPRGADALACSVHLDPETDVFPQYARTRNGR